MTRWKQQSTLGMPHSHRETYFPYTIDICFSLFIIVCRGVLFLSLILSFVSYSLQQKDKKKLLILRNDLDPWLETTLTRFLLCCRYACSLLRQGMKQILVSTTNEDDHKVDILFAVCSVNIYRFLSSYKKRISC